MFTTVIYCIITPYIISIHTYVPGKILAAPAFRYVLEYQLVSFYNQLSIVTCMQLIRQYFTLQLVQISLYLPMF